MKIVATFNISNVNRRLSHPLSWLKALRPVPQKKRAGGNWHGNRNQLRRGGYRFWLIAETATSARLLCLRSWRGRGHDTLLHGSGRDWPF